MGLTLACACVGGCSLGGTQTGSADQHDVLPSVKVSFRDYVAQIDLIDISPANLPDIDLKKPVERPQLNADLRDELSAYRYSIAPSDLLTVSVPGHPEFTEDVDAKKGLRVRPDGTIRLPILGDVRVEGLTEPELERLLEGRLSAFVEDPLVSVAVTDYQGRFAIVTGAVRRRIALTSLPITIGQLLTDGELNASEARADWSRALLVREGEEIRELNLRSLLFYGDQTQDVMLQDRDLIFVPGGDDASVLLAGEIYEKGRKQIDPFGLSLAAVLLDAGGFRRSSDVKTVLILRNLQPQADLFDKAGFYDWNPKIYRMDMSDIASYLIAQQVFLKPRDIVYVASSKLADWNDIIQLLSPSINTLFLLETLDERLNN